MKNQFKSRFLNFKRIFATVLVFAVFCWTTFLFAGCTYKTYNFVGVINPEDSTIVEYENLEENVKSYVDTYAYKTSYFELKKDGTYVFSRTSITGNMETTYKVTGDYTIEDKVLSLKMVSSQGAEWTDKQQYINETIIYFDGVYFIAYR